jgi:putative oxidoreductase
MARPLDLSTGYPATPTEQPASDGQRAFVGGAGRVAVLDRYAPLAARVLVSQIFLLSGVMKLIDPAGTQQQMAEKGMFWVPLFFVGAVVFELAGGLSLLLGYKARLGALALILFLIPVTLVFHSFWTYADPKEQKLNMIMFLHNLTLMGGLLLFMTFGPGPLSFDHRKEPPA